MAGPSQDKPESELQRLRAEIRRLRAENEELRRRLGTTGAIVSSAADERRNSPGVTNRSPVAEKIRLFRGLFRGREDVYPVRWENRQGRAGYSPACGNEWHQTLCDKPRIKCGACPNSRFLPVTDEVIRDHLSGKHTVGVYPILPDGSCWLLAIDFDKSSWRDDALAFRDTCRDFEVPAYIERSRSGQGAHVWIFFTSAIPAAQARQLGSLILTRATDQRPGIGLESYDRFFPSQDTVPKGGFGNLIALPLQKLPREHGNSEFLDDQLETAIDQWAHLDGIRRITPDEVERLVRRHDVGDDLLGVRRVGLLDEESGDPWLRLESPDHPQPRVAGVMPQRVNLVLSDSLYIRREGLPPQLQNQVIRLAAFQNPEFYRAQAMRMSTHGKPRIISCADCEAGNIVLPRGCHGAAISTLEGHGIEAVVHDQRLEGHAIDVSFLGSLRVDQRSAVHDMLNHGTGVLCAPTAFGKTVVAAALIARRKRNTLILVHRRQLMDQWRERLASFLDRPLKAIGRIGAGKRAPTGEIDVAVMQSIFRKGKVDALVGDYGHVVVDEAHHVSAFSFESILKKVRARYILGLTATPIRKDGHHPIILMQCGPIRHRVSPQQQRESTGVVYRVIPRVTEFRVPDGEDPGIQALYGKLARDDRRNDQLFDDILRALEESRSPLVLTERVGHAEAMAARLARFAKNVIVLRGGLTRKKAAEVLRQLASIPEGQERLIIATGRYIGEGFDDARLDTLFLTMPISWKGTLQQYVGRLHRKYEGKQEVRVYDYVDHHVGVLQRMYERRLRGYKAIGYEIASNT